MLSPLFSQLHPVARNNFLPRIFASYGFLLFAWTQIGSELFTLPYSLVLIGGTIWPFLALVLSSISGKKFQEIINMHVDVIMSSFICIMAPQQWIVFSVAIVLSSNAIFVGSFKMLLSTLAVFFAIIMTSKYFYGWEWQESSANLEWLVMCFLFIYFNLFAWMGFQLVRSVLSLNKKVKRLSIKDSLTGCFNRMYLDKQLPIDLGKSIRVKYPITVIFCDIDYFKKINDTFGHKAGDEVLKTFGELLNTSIRKDVDWVSRYGGEEFVIVLTNSETKGGLKVAERIQDRLRQLTFNFNDTKQVITCSFGISSIENFDEPINAETLLKSADNCLYQAKENGRDRIEVYQSMNRS